MQALWTWSLTTTTIALFCMTISYYSAKAYNSTKRTYNVIIIQGDKN